MNNLEQTESLNGQLDVLLTDIQKFEKDLIPQLDGLAAAIPEIYKGYANIVREIVSKGIEICQPSSNNAVKIQLAAEIGARSIVAYGKYKAAKEHNRRLQKYLTIKANYANANLQIVENLLPKLQNKSTSTGRLFKKCTSIQYDLASFTENTVDRITVIQNKALTMHRTSVFLYELCSYLIAEYKAWMNGYQTSDQEMPDYYAINQIFVQNIYGNDIFSSFEEAAECDVQISGSQIMLLSDYQLTIMALGDRVCRIHEEHAHPMVIRIMNNCGAHIKYSEIIAPYIKQLDDDPFPAIVFFGILTFIGILCIEIFYIDADFLTKLIIGSLSLGAIFKICYKGARQARIVYVKKSLIATDKINKELNNMSGKVERPQIDYAEQNTTMAAVKGFFN